MKLRKFDNFRLNESVRFTESQQLRDFFAEKINDDLIKDNLMEVYDLGDIVDVQLYRNLIDSNNLFISSYIREDETYKIQHSISIRYKIDRKNSFEDFTKITNDLNTINTCIEETIARSTFKLLRNFVENAYDVKKILYTINLTQEIETEDLMKYYNEWLIKTEINFIAGIRYLEEKYRENGIDNPSQHIDIQDSDDTFLIGFFIEDEIIVIANYNSKTKKFSIDHREVNSSIAEYRQDQDEY